MNRRCKEEKDGDGRSLCKERVICQKCRHLISKRQMTWKEQGSILALG